METFEIDSEFPNIGRRIMHLSSREIQYPNDRKKSLLTIYDVTKQRLMQAEREDLIKQKDLLLKEMRHRIANSLQLIASIMLLKAGMVESEETRFHLNDAHERIMSIATVQRQLDPGGIGDDIDVGPYLKSICESVARSMIGARKPISVVVKAGAGVVSSETAINLGLMTTELVINAIKHAFPENREGVVTVSYASKGLGWTLTVADNGVGKQPKKKGRQGLGTSLVAAITSQLSAEENTESAAKGTSVTITYNGKSAKIAA